MRVEEFQWQLISAYSDLFVVKYGGLIRPLGYGDKDGFSYRLDGDGVVVSHADFEFKVRPGDSLTVYRGSGQYSATINQQPAAPQPIACVEDESVELSLKEHIVEVVAEHGLCDITRDEAKEHFGGPRELSRWAMSHGLLFEYRAECVVFSRG